jgi:hypothetical protein
VNRIEDLDIRPVCRNLRKCAADVLKSLSEILPPVTRYQDQSLRWIQKRELRSETVLEPRVFFYQGKGGEKGVNCCIACDVYGLRIYCLVDEVLSCAGSGSKMQVRNGPRNPAIHLFGIGSKFVSGPKTRLHMGDFRAAVKRGKSGGHSGSGVTVHENQVRTILREHAPQTGQYRAGYLEKVLAGPHDVEVKIRIYIERRKDLVEHLPVLSGNADSAGEVTGMPLQFLYDGRHFYGFGAGAEYDENLRHYRYDPIFS